MPRGGARPGGGRRVGSKNKATLQREAEAAARVAAASGGKAREAALSVMERLLITAEGAAALLKPTAKRNWPDQATVDPNPDASWPMFKDFLGLAFDIAKEVTKYQAPQIKAVDAPAPAPDPDVAERESQIRFGLRVFEGGKPVDRTGTDA